MPSVSVSFRFSQRFDLPAREVYAWATDYDPRDIELLGRRGRRKIQRICDDTLLLTDTFVLDDGTAVRKPKLVRLYPERLAWTNTHVGGPNRYSQFLYELFEEGKAASRLDFTGRQIVELENPTKQEIAALAKSIRKEDAAMWKNLAREVGRSRKKRGRSRA